MGAYEAAQAFSRARRKANLRQVLAAFGASHRKLLSYDDVRRRLHALEGSAPVLEDVPLDAIVGSVGRYNDFTREFLPRGSADKSRWVGVNLAMTGPVGTPPVELYRIGQAYFVRDGNHRVSVARQLGAPTIQAYVTPVYARVPFAADVDPSDLILLEEHARFVENTGIDQLRPGASLNLTVPGQYGRLLEHIEVHRYFMGLDEKRDVPYGEAVAHWYDTVYQPVVEAIRASGALRDFPGRTETDLYLWLSEHRARLGRELGLTLPSESIAEAMGSGGGGQLQGAEQRDDLLQQVRERKPGGHQAEVTIADDVLVALPDLETGMPALQQALLVARRERSRVYVVHVAPLRAAASVDSSVAEPAPFVALPETAGAAAAVMSPASPVAVGSDAATAVGSSTANVAGPGAAHPAGRPSEHADVDALREAVLEAGEEAGVEIQFAVAHGDPSQALRERAAWVDLVVAPLVVPANGGWRLLAGYDGLLRRSPRPVLSAAGGARELNRALVAYDGGSRAEQALFVGAYMAAKWDASLVVATVSELPRNAATTLASARSYLERFGVQADYVERRGPVADALVSVADERDCDVILMGSYRYSRWLESLLGGVLERTLLAAGRPVLVL